jgi:hypothetical protein
LSALGPAELTVDDGTPRQLAAENVLRVNFSKPASPTPASADTGVVLLANGDRLFARATGADGEHLTVDWPVAPQALTVRIPLETVVALAFEAPDSGKAQGRLLAELSRARQSSDVVLLTNGDRASGEIVSMNAKTVALKTPAGEAKIDQAGIRAVLFNGDLVSFPKAEGIRLLLSLTDGSRLTVRAVALTDRGTLRAMPLFGGELEILLSQIREARVLGGRAVYLSDLEAAAYQFTPYLSLSWPLQKDTSVTGAPLRLGGEEYPKGLGLHSQSVVVYRLDGKYRRFLAVGGVDDAAGERGSVVLAVDVDDKRAVTSPVLTTASQPFEIGPLDVAGKQRLTLHVDFGPFGDIEDHANWCDAVLIR